MSQKRCCVPDCQVTLEDGVPLHRFPDPEKGVEKLKNWISNIGDILDNVNMYSNRRICHKHFKDIYKYPKNKLSNIAVPELYVPGPGLFNTPSTSGLMNSKQDIIIPGLVTYLPYCPNKPVGLVVSDLNT